MANRQRTAPTPRTHAAEVGVPPRQERPSEAVAVSREDIERRAYDLYQQRGAGDGNALDDWLQAERDLQRE